MNDVQMNPVRVRYSYEDPVEMLRARALLVISAGVVVIGTAVFSFFALAGGWSDLAGNLTVILVLWVLGATNVFLVQTGRSKVSARLYAVACVVGSASSLLLYGPEVGTAMLFSVTILVATMLLGWRGIIYAALACIAIAVAVLLLYVGDALGEEVTAGMTEDEATIGIGLLIMGVAIEALILGLFAGTLEESLGQAMRTAANLRATAETSRAMISYLAVEPLLVQTVAMIRERFGLYHVQAYLLGPSDNYAVLMAGTGRAGRQLLSQRHRVAVGSRSAVGRAATLNEPVLVKPHDPLFQPSPLLSETRTELAVPLQTGDQIIGVLDVQSTQDDAFSPDDIAGLQALANQLATTVERIRLFEELQARLAENEHLLAENQVRLAEVEELNRRLTGQAWASYLSSRGTDTLGYDWVDGKLQPERSWTPGLVATVGAPEASLRREGDLQVLTVPITLRDGSALGAIELSTDRAIWDQHSKELVQEVANRLSISLESARLFEDSQRLANRERLMNEVSAKFQSSPDISGLLSMAADEIRQALSAHTVTVQLNLSDEDISGD